MNKNEKEKQVIKTIEKIRPYINQDGGDVQFVRLEDDIVYVRVLGACVGCSALEQTLQDGVAALIMDEVEGIKEVKLAEPDYEAYKRMIEQQEEQLIAEPIKKNEDM